MSTIPNIKDKKLDNIAKKLQFIVQKTLEHHLEIGKLLCEAREEFKADQDFGQWRKENTVLTMHQTTNHMAVWRKFGGHAPARDLSFTVMVELLSADETTIAEVVQMDKPTKQAARDKVKQEKSASHNGAQIMADILAGGEAPKNGHGARARKIIDTAPELAKKVAVGEVSMSHAERECDYQLRKASESPEATPEEIAALAEKFKEGFALTGYCMYTQPHEFAQRSMYMNHKEVSDFLDSLNKSTGKRMLKAFFNLIQSFKDKVEMEARQRVPYLQANLDKRIEELDAREEKMNNRERTLKKVLSDDDVKRIRSCLHPDRAPEGREERFKKALQAFNKAL